jgi:hypothetical protein
MVRQTIARDGKKLVVEREGGRVLAVGANHERAASQALFDALIR